MSELGFVSSRRRGRPTSAVPKETRTFYMPTSYLDRLNALAVKHGVSTNEVLCKAVDLALRMPGEFPYANK